MLVVFLRLLQTEFMLWHENIKDKLINLVIWASATAIVSGYIMQAFGVQSNYGVIQAGGIIVAAAGFEMYGHVFAMTSDLEGIRYINYHFILPVSNWVIFAAKAAFFVFNCMMLTLLALPLCKVLLWKHFSLLDINYPRFFLALLVTNLFFAGYCLWLSSKVTKAADVDNVFMRFIFPLWYFGCFSFTWFAAYAISPVLGILCLVSPYTYATEAIRASMLGAQGYMSFWLCITILVVMSLFAAGIGYNSLKKRLDFI